MLFVLDISILVMSINWGNRCFGYVGVPARLSHKKLSSLSVETSESINSSIFFPEVLRARLTEDVGSEAAQLAHDLRLIAVADPDIILI